jgi:hypothetical protein
MRGPVNALVITGSMLLVFLGALAPASAATTTTPAPPVMDTSNFACSSGVCEVGPGNVGVPFAAALNVTGDGVTQSVEAYYGDYFTMKIISGSLPLGLQLTLPDSEWTITGTPTKAGNYPLTVQFTPTQDAAPNGGPSGTQQLTVTIGTGNSDRLHLTRAVWAPNTVNKFLQIAGFDANAGATYTVYVTSSGKEIGTLTESTLWNDGSILSNFRVSPNAGILSETSPGTITVRDSLGGSATIALTVSLKYS